jgi:tetratricopeptide (TPR) repeat protein
MGSIVYRAGLFPEALGIYSKALALGDSAHVALDNSALLAAVTGQRALAARLGDELTRTSPRDAAFQLRRATIAFNALELDVARKHALRALELNSSLDLARNLLGMLADAHRAGIDSANASVEVSAAILTDMRALRYPELTVKTREQLARQTIDDDLLRRAIEYVSVKGSPEDARELCQSYISTRRPPDAERLADAVALRAEVAANVRSHLAELPSYAVAPR